MTRSAHLGALAACALLLGGCASLGRYRLVEPGARAMAGAYTVQPALAWSSIRSGKTELWTIDGLTLESLSFFTGIAEGESILGGRSVDDRRARFSASMTLPEVAELVADSLFGRFPPRNVRPASFGGAPGFRFEVSYATRDGVQREALVAAAVLHKQLYVIAYSGTSLHHFARYRAQAEHVIDSVRLTGAVTPTHPR
jgi:hypothetical protein